MLDNIINYAINKQCEKKIISDDELEIYRYGYTLLFEVIINIMLAFVIGIIFNEIFAIVIFLLIFIPLRSYCGGWHAPTMLTCTIISNTVIIILALLSKWCFVEKYIIVFFIFDIVMSLGISLLSPSEDNNKKISINEIKMYKKIVVAQILIHFIISVILIIFKRYQFFQIILLAHIFQMILLLLNKKC